MLVAEQLLLLALDPEKGRPGLGKKSGGVKTAHPAHQRSPM